ncbi:MAG: DUF938 domain-containing protein [Erythrobacter sp.]|nr:DUF938 domain-containing protein [Erythrobacter sp.]
MKKHAPATSRNREAILAILRHELPEWGAVLEVASGSGEHAVYFAEHMPALAWQPSDPSSEAIASIEAYRAEYEGVNLREPLVLDASQIASWPIERADAILCCNMVHIAPWEATVGLFAGAGRLLEEGAPLVLYGPYFEAEVEPAPSNVDFDVGLRERNPDWGIRTVRSIDDLAGASGFNRSARHEMPANNLTLVYRRR